MLHIYISYMENLFGGLEFTDKIRVIYIDRGVSESLSLFQRIIQDRIDTKANFVPKILVYIFYFCFNCSDYCVGAGGLGHRDREGQPQEEGASRQP